MRQPFLTTSRENETVKRRPPKQQRASNFRRHKRTRARRHGCAGSTRPRVAGGVMVSARRAARTPVELAQGGYARPPPGARRHVHVSFRPSREFGTARKRIAPGRALRGSPGSARAHDIDVASAARDWFVPRRAHERRGRGGSHGRARALERAVAQDARSRPPIRRRVRRRTRRRAVFDGASAEREPPPVADKASARERERVAAIARAFRGLERAGETPVKRVSPFAADAADASSSEPLKERSLKERAVAEPAELSAIRALDRAAYFFSSDQCLSPYDAKGETADEAFARLSLRGARERRDEPTAEAFRTARDGAKRTTLFRLTRVKLAMARAEEEAKSAQTASERVVAAQVVY